MPTTVIIEKWGSVEIDTDDTETALREAAAQDAAGTVPFQTALTLDGCGSPAAKMDVALRKIASLRRPVKGTNPQLAEAIRIAKAAIPDSLVDPGTP